MKKILMCFIIISILISNLVIVKASTLFNDYKYEKEAEILNTLNLYKGVSTKEFNPDLASMLDRETGITMFLRILGEESEALKMSKRNSYKILNSKFSDGNSVSKWACKQVAYAVNNGYIKGYPNGEIRPQKNLSARDYCSMILNKLEYNFEYDLAGKVFCKNVGIFNNQLVNLFNSSDEINKNILVGISFNTLRMYYNEKNITVSQNLANKGLVSKEDFKNVGITVFNNEESSNSDPKATPTTPVATLTPISTLTPNHTTPLATMAVGATTTPVATSIPTPKVTSTSSISEKNDGLNIELEFTSNNIIAKGQGNIKVGTIKLTSINDVEITEIKVKRSGFSADRDIESIALYQLNKKMTRTGVFFNNIASMKFTESFKLIGEETAEFDIMFDLTENSGGEIFFEIEESNYIVSDTVNISGKFPFKSNKFSIANINVGSISVEYTEDAPSNAYIETIAKDVVLGKYKIQALHEPIKFKGITFYQDGSAVKSKIVNIKFYKENEEFGNLGVFVNDYVTLVIPDGYDLGLEEELILELRADIYSEKGDTVKLDISNKGDIEGKSTSYNVNVMGNNSLEGIKFTSF